MSIKILPNDDKSRLARIGLTGPDAPIPLKDACKNYFSGTISVATLKAEHKRGNLEISRIGRQYFTTLNQIRKMIKKCRVVVSPPISRQEVIDNRDLEWRKAAQLALQLRLERRKKDRLDEIPPMGAIYLMSRSDVENLGVGKVEAPELPLQFLRIHRQRGRFIQPTYPGLLAEAGLFDRWVFHHTEVGLPFICPALGVSRETLMPEEIESIDTTGSSPPAV